MWHSTVVDVTVRMILHLAAYCHLMGMVQGLSTHSCLLAARQENMRLFFWKCNATFNREACVVKDRQSLIHKFGPKAGNAIPMMSKKAVCGSGPEESKQCLYLAATTATDVVISWAAWSGTDPTRTRMAWVTDRVQFLPCPYIWQREKPKDCTQVIIKGVNTIYPYPDTSIGVSVYCNLTFNRGGWTVLQKRYNGNVDFYKTWAEYEAGFGDPAGEHWLGLAALYAMTKDIPTELYIGLTDANDVYKDVRYGAFYVYGIDYDYSLAIGSYSGSAGDSFSAHYNYKFSAHDKDFDGHPTINCPVSRHGGWWYQSCGYSNLNGKFSNSSIEDQSYMYWYHFNEAFVSLKTSVMMFRPLSHTQP